MLTTIADLEKHADVLDQLAPLAGLYQRYLENPYEGHRTPGIHASEVTKCRRQAYYTLRGVKGTSRPNASMQVRFEHGHAIHEMVQRQLRYMTNTCKDFTATFEAEVSTAATPLGKSHKITSHCDGILSLLDANKKPFIRVGLEIKSEAHDSYVKLSGPKEAHLDQATVYMAALDLPLMWFLYINKNNGEHTPMIEPWLVRFDAPRWQRIFERIEDTLAHAEAEVLPAVQQGESGFHCTFCKYQSVCKANEQTPTFTNLE